MWEQVKEDLVLSNTREFFDCMYKVWFLPNIFIWIYQYFCLRHVIYKNVFFLVQCEFLVAINVAIELYYEEAPNEKLKSPSILQTLMDKVMN
jgi:hypothetical protein